MRSELYALLVLLARREMTRQRDYVEHDHQCGLSAAKEDAIPAAKRLAYLLPRARESALRSNHRPSMLGGSVDEREPRNRHEEQEPPRPA